LERCDERLGRPERPSPGALASEAKAAAAGEKVLPPHGPAGSAAACRAALEAWVEVDDETSRAWAVPRAGCVVGGRGSLAVGAVAVTVARLERSMR